MKFKNRKEAGILLAKKLKKYKDQHVIVYAIPRGGVIVASEIAKKLNAPLDLIITRKIGHSDNPEYAIAALSEKGYIIKESEDIEAGWFAEKIKEETLEAERRRKKYLAQDASISVKGKIAILVDDGVATGLSLRVGIKELKDKNPKKIVVAVPVIAESTAKIIQSEVDELAAIQIPSDFEFKGSVGAYFENFDQVEDPEVIEILKN